MNLLDPIQLKRFALFMLLFIGINFSASASHYSGGELTFAYTGPNQYLVTFTVYRDCNGVTVGGTQIVNYSSATCGVSASLTLNLQSTTEVTPLCPSEPSACSGGGTLGIQLLVFQATLNLPPGCSDWVLSTESCCRNAAITNLATPSNQSIYIEAHLDNTAGLMDSSPSFSSPPQFFGCVGQTINFQQLAYDADGDVLVYSLVSAMQNGTTNVNYAGGFSGVNPFTVPLVLNPSTGQITFTPNVPQVAVVSVLIEEYRNGVLIGSIMRDIQFVIRPCNNNLPNVSGINNVPGVYSITICEGSSTCFNIFGTDPDAGQNLSLTYAGAIPGAVFTQTGTATSPSGTFCWNSAGSPPGTYNFSVTAEDDACPLIGQNSILFTVVVIPNPNPPVNAGADVSICAGDTVMLNATSIAAPGIIASYNWTPSSTLSTPNAQSTDAFPVTTTSYTVTLLYTDGCTSTDAVAVTVLADPDATAFPTNGSACGGANFILTGTTNAPGMNFQWFDPSMTPIGSGMVIGSQSSLSITVPSAPGTYAYTLTVTNPVSGCQSTDTAYLTVGAPPALPSCVNIYVSTTGTVASAGTQADPTTLAEGLARASCNDAIIKMATGTYIINNPLNIGSFVTIEGGFQQGSAWTKISTPGATTITRSTLNPEGPIGQQRLVAFYGNGAIGWRLQDVTITTANANLAGESTYALHLNGCADYQIVRTQLLPGSAGNGTNGAAGAAGAPGAAGIQGASGSCDGGTCTFSSGDPGAAGGIGGIGGGGAAAGGGGAAANGVQNNGTAGTGAVGRNGGGGGGGGAGGDECSTNNAGLGAAGGTSACAAGGLGGNRGGQGDPGGDGANGTAGGAGTAGVSGAAGPVGSFVGGFWIPGAPGGNGTDGCGGGGGAGGGGGGRQTCTFCDNGPGNGGSGGGGGGQGGTGGIGGTGGGSCYGLVLLNNGANAFIDQSNFVVSAAGTGGTGGSGGNGGAGGAGAPRRTTCTSEIGEGGAGGAGGVGGNGGAGGNGTPGQAFNYLFVSGTVPVTTTYTFNLSAQPIITASNVNCVDTDVNFVTPSAVTWNFTSNATPQSPTGVSVITQFNAINRYNIVAGANTYEGFHNIAFGGNLNSEIATNAPPIGVDTFLVCQGDFTSFESVYYADVYAWNFNGAIPNPGNIQVVSSQFNIPGFFPITMSMTTDCCGLSPADVLYLYVVPVSTATGSGNVAICEGESSVLSLAGLNPNDSVVWSPTLNSVSVAPGSISVNPLTSITYTASVYSSVTGGGQTIYGCPISIPFVVTVNPNPVLTVSSTAVICSADGTATATTSGGGLYNFTWDNGGSTNNSTSSTITGLTVGNYQVTATNVASGCTASDSIDVNPSASSPVIYVQTLVGTCEDDTDGAVTVAVAGGTAPFTFIWSDIGAGPPSRLGLAGGNYSVTVNDALGCSSSLTFDIPEYESPHATVTANGPICAGDSAYFEIIGHDGITLTYNFGGPDATVFFFEDTIYLSVLNATADVTINLVSADNGQCVEVLGLSATTVVLPLPAVAITTNSPVCAGEDAIFTFTGTPGSIVTYSIGGGPTQSTTLVGGTADVTVIGALVDQTIVLDSIDDGSCIQFSGATETIIVNPLPIVTAGVDQSVCDGASVTLNGGGAISYVWDNSVTDGVAFIQPIGTVTYTVTGTDVNGCENTDQVDVTVAPGAVVNAGVDQTVCGGTLVTLTGSGVVSYAWDNGVTDGVAFTPPSGTTTYTVTGTDVNGCTNTDQVDVTVNTPPTVNAGIDQTVCDGVLITLNGSGSSGYVWDNGVTDGVAFSQAVGTITYTVTVTDALGCSNTDQVDVTVTPLPVVDAGSDKVVCDGTQITLIGAGAVSYVWDNGVVDGVPFAQGVGTITYTVTGTDANGCVNTDQIDVTVNALPTVDAGLDQTVCEGVNVTLNGAGGTSYLWDNGVVDGVAFTSPVGTTTYTVTGTDANGCTNTDQVDVTVTPLPTVDAGADQSTCDGTSVTLSATNPSGAILTWNNGVVDGVSFTPLGTQTYTVTATNAAGCVNSDDVTITVNPNPTEAFMADELDGCEPLQVVFTNLSTPGSVLCEWDFGDGQTAVGCGSMDHIYANAGLYTVTLTITDANGCSDVATYVDYLAVYQQPTAEFGFEGGSLIDVLNTEVQLENLSSNATTYLWNFGDGSATSTATNPLHTFPDGGSANFVITLYATNGGCIDSVQHIIQIEDLLIYYIPNTFTPDGNSVNQTFQPVFSSGYDPYDFQMLIFNRWGEIVFETHDVNVGWDGTFNGVMAQDGTYTWTVEFKELMSDQRHVDNGHVNLIR